MRKTGYYPYLILIACCGLMAATYGFFNTQGLYLDAISAELNVGRGTVSFSSTLTLIVSAVAAPTVAIKLRSKYSIRPVLIVSGILTILMHLAVTMFPSVVTLYLYGMIFGLTMAVYGNTFVVEMLNSWFEKSGTATGIAMSVSGVFGMFYAPFATSLIEKYGWRNAYYSYAVILLLIMSYAVIVIRNKDYTVPAEAEKKEKVFNKALLLLALYFIAGASFTSFGNYIASYGVSIGFTLSQGAILSSTISIGNLVLKLIFGYLTDRIGGYRTALINFLAIVAGIVVLLAGGNNYIIAIVACFLIGSCYATSNVISRGLCRDLFGKEQLGIYYATLNVFSAVQAFSYTFVGSVYDRCGSYIPAVYILLLLLVIGFILVTVDFRQKKKHQ